MAIGIGNTTNLFASAADLQKKSFASLITRLMPNGQAPLFGLTSMLKDKTAAQFTHGYFSKTMIFPSLTVSGAGQLIGDTTFTIVSNSQLMPGMLFRNDLTGEIVIINTVVDATHVTVTRAVGTVAAAAVAASQTFTMSGNAFEEASIRPAPQYIIPVQNTNYTQIFRNSWGISDTVRASLTIAGDGNSAENRNDAAMFHAVDLEKALFWGQKFLGTRNGQPFHTMDGIINRVTVDASSNVTTLGATTTFTQLETALDPMFATTTDPKGSMDRIAFVGGTMHRVLNNIGRLNATYMINQGETEYGLRFESFKLTRGMIHIVEHPLFNINTTWAKMGVFLDLNSISLAYLGDRRTRYQAYNANNGEVPSDNGIDAVGGTYTTEVTMELTNPSAHAILYNATAAAVG